MKSITKTSCYYLALVLFYMLISFLIAFVPKSYFSTNLILSLGQLIIIVPSIIYIVFTKFRPIKEIRAKKLSVSNILILILFTYLCMPLLNLVNYISMFFVENNVVEVFGLLTENPLWVNIFFIAVLPAFCEELIFRGILYHSYRKRNIFRAMLISAVLFGLFHLNINQLVYALLMGIIFCFVIEVTESIFSSMIMHFIFNANSVILYFVINDVFHINNEALTKQMSMSMENFGTYQIILTTTILVAMAIISTTLAVLVFYWLCKRNGKLEHIQQIIKKPHRKVSNKDFGRLISPPLIIGIIICISYIIYSDILL